LHTLLNIIELQREETEQICEMARSMLIEKEMLVILWAEAVNTAVYIQNRCYTTSVIEKTLFEAFT